MYKNMYVCLNEVMINYNENEAENEKQVTQIGHKQTQAQTWTKTY